MSVRMEARDLRVVHVEKTVLDIGHLAIEANAVLTLIGPNGSGKSTLLRVLALLQRPTEGSVRLDGEEVASARHSRALRARRRVTMVMQDPLLCRMSVEQNLQLGLRFRGLPGRERSRRIDRWLDRLAIGHLRQQRGDRLSGGEAQRVSLARALALEPEVLLLDEPFAALDAPTRQSLLVELKSVLTEAKVTAVFATHDRGEAMVMGERIAVLLEGQVAQLATPQDVFTRPASEDVARFVGVETLLPGRVVIAQKGLVTVAVGDLTIDVLGSAAVDDSVQVGIRPEEITLTRAEPAKTSARNVLRGTVTVVTPSEGVDRVEIDCGSLRLVAAVTRPSIRELEIKPGAEVHAMFKASAAHILHR